MDLLTQGLLGAGLAAACAPEEEVRRAAAIGVVAGLVPDLDVLIRSGSDPLVALEYHRQFTHALLMIPLIGLVGSVLAWPIWRKAFPFVKAYMYAVAGCAGAGVLDACTSYGTHLLWPLSSTPVAWSLVSIVDPVATLVLLVPLLLALRKRSRWLALLSVGVLVLYMGFAWLQQYRAENVARTQASLRGHTVERLLVKPAFGTTLLWRAQYITGDSVHVDAVRVGFLEPPCVYPGARAQHLSLQSLLRAGAHPLTATPERRVALQRWHRLTDDWLIPGDTLTQSLGDARFAMLPTRLNPMFSLAPVADSARVQLLTDRTFTPDDRTLYLSMLTGCTEAARPASSVD